MQFKSSRVIFTLLIFVYAVLLLRAELNPTHVVNPEWPGHARLHNVWLLVQNASLCVLSLYLIWKQSSRENLLIAGLIGTIIFACFLITGITSPLYGGSLTDPGAEVLLIQGMDINVFVLDASFIVSLMCMRGVYRSIN